MRSADKQVTPAARKNSAQRKWQSFACSLRVDRAVTHLAETLPQPADLLHIRCTHHLELTVLMA